jgi:hypothetical protein
MRCVSASVRKSAAADFSFNLGSSAVGVVGVFIAVCFALADGRLLLLLLPLGSGSASAENGWIPTREGVVQPYPAPDSTDDDS